MKIAGKQPGVNKGVIEFHRPGNQLFRLIVQAVPYGFAERVERELPLPDPPVEFAKDPKTGAVLRDEFGLAAKTEKRADRKFRAESRRIQTLRAVMQAREALRGDPQVQFDNDDAAKKLLGARAWAEKIEAEFAEAGFTDSEVVAIFGKSLELNRGAAQRVDEAAESFLSASPEPAPAGNSRSAPDALKST